MKLTLFIALRTEYSNLCEFQCWENFSPLPFYVLPQPLAPSHLCLSEDVSASSRWSLWVNRNSKFAGSTGSIPSARGQLPRATQASSTAVHSYKIFFFQQNSRVVTCLLTDSVFSVLFKAWGLADQHEVKITTVMTVFAEPSSKQVHLPGSGS